MFTRKGFKEPWCTLYLARNTSAPLHQDKRNDPKQWVWVVTLGEFRGGGIWVEGDGQVGPVAKVLPNGLVKAGSVEDAQNRAISFEGHRWHATEPWFGKDRWVIVAFTPRDACKIIGQYSEELVGLGFKISALTYSPGESVDSATISKCNGADEAPLGDRCANGDSLEGSADLATISKFNDPEYFGAAISGRVGDTEGTYYEIEFPHLIVGEARLEEWCNRAVKDHLRSARLCKSLSKEISGLEDVCAAGELCRALSETECQREWYEGLLWDDYLRTSVGAVKALSQEVPLCPSEDSPAEIFLQTRNVSVAEARKELPLWIPSAQEEITSLELTNQAVDRIVTADIERLVQEGCKITQVPGKAVLTRKAGVGKRRFRCVACGNYIPQGAHDPTDLYASGVEGLTVRTTLGVAAYKGWSALSADIRTAFLHAPLTDELESDEVIIVKPPSLLVEMKLMSHNHRWRVRKALYGLRQGPLAWARFRDKSLSTLTFLCDGIVYALRQGISDDSLWFIVKTVVGPEDAERWQGFLIIYVDDLLGFAPVPILRALFEEIQRLWKLSPPEWVNEAASTTFCGLEIKAMKGGGFQISQCKYLQELFTRYGIQCSVSAPLAHWSDPEDEPSASVESIREAQGLVGALLWASTKSRPDIAFAVSKLGQFAVKAPSVVIEKGYQVLKYLHGTADLWIEYRRPTGSEVVDAPVPRKPSTVELYTDASHAPEGSRSCQAVFITWCNMLLCWEASKQPFVTLSSAEAELVAVVSGIVAAESVGGILEELICEDIIVSALCDNAATVRAFATGSLGWRNRHLRMRAAAGRERIRAGSLVVSFVPGSVQLADLATKPLPRARILHLLELLNVRSESKNKDSDDHVRVLSRLSHDGSTGSLVSSRVLAGLALIAAIPRARGQPLGADLDVYGWMHWVFSAIFIGVLGVWWFFEWAGCDLTSEIEASLGIWTGVQGTEGVELELCSAYQSASSDEEVEDTPGATEEDADSDVFDEVEWQQARQDLIKRELYTGLTFIQRARLRQQLVKGELVDAPVMSQRYGPLPEWYSGVGFSVDSDAPAPNVQVGGSSSSQDESGVTSTGVERVVSSAGAGTWNGAEALFVLLQGHGVVLIGFTGQHGLVSSRLRQVSSVFRDCTLLVSFRELSDTGNSELVSTLSSSIEFRFVQNGDQNCWVPVEMRHLPQGFGAQEGGSAFSSGHLPQGFGAQVGGSAFSSGHLPQGFGAQEGGSAFSSGHLPQGFGAQVGGSASSSEHLPQGFGAQVGGSASSSEHLPQGFVALVGGSASSLDPFPQGFEAQVGGSASSSDLLPQDVMPVSGLTYEDLVEEELEPAVFPIVGEWLRRHYVEQLLSLEGVRLLIFLGDRSRGVLNLRTASPGMRYALCGALVDDLRSGPWAALFSGPQWLQAVERYLRYGLVDSGFQGEESREWEGFESLEGTAFPYVPWAPPYVTHFLRRILAHSGCLVLELLGARAPEWVRLRWCARTFKDAVMLAVVQWLQRNSQNRVADGSVAFDAATAYVQTGSRGWPYDEDDDDATLDEVPYRPIGPPVGRPVGFYPIFQGVLEEESSSSEGGDSQSTGEPSLEDRNVDSGEGSDASEAQGVHVPEGLPSAASEDPAQLEGGCDGDFAGSFGCRGWLYFRPVSWDWLRKVVVVVLWLWVLFGCITIARAESRDLAVVRSSIAVAEAREVRVHSEVGDVATLCFNGLGCDGSHLEVFSAVVKVIGTREAVESAFSRIKDERHPRTRDDAVQSEDRYPVSTWQSVLLTERPLYGIAESQGSVL